MNLVKWIRKNNRKIMVFVVVFIMLAFVVGQFGLKMLVSVMGGGSQLIASYDDGKKIKSQDYMQAQSELTVLRMLMADRLLLAQSRNGLSGPLLAYLLFPDSQFAGEIASLVKQTVQRGQLPISSDQLDGFFQQQREQPEILWILLKAEAYRAGTILPNDSAAETLRMTIPQMTGGQIDAEGLVGQIISQNNISQDQILRIFADLISVMTYAGNVMDNEAVTINQIKGTIGRNVERIDADYAEVAAAPFIDADAAISEAQIQEQFAAFKAVAPSIPTEDNPFGFGYKLGKRVQLEYMLVKMDDVTLQIDPLSPELLEDYYSNNVDSFQAEELSDPNDPESEKISRTQTFAEVESQIRQSLEREKTDTLANIVFNEIKDKTEAGFETVNIDEATAAELQKAAAIFETVSQPLAEKHKIPIITGKTGWLNAEQLGADPILRSLGMRRGQNYLRLPDLAMNVSEEKTQRRKIGMPSIRVWENIGPFNGGYYSEEEGKYYPLMALVRVVGIQAPEVPGSVDVEFQTQGAVLNADQPQDASVFSLKDIILEDLRLVKAMDTARERAEELSALVSEKGWDDGLDAYNDKYAPDPNAPDAQTVTLSSDKQLLRMPTSNIKMIRRLLKDNPGAAGRVQQQLTSNMLTNTLYELLEQDAASTGTIQTVVPFEAKEACLVVKQVTRQPATLKDYADGKANTALQLGMIQSVPLVLDHFKNENILKRMNYESELKKDSPETEPDTPAEDTEKE